MAKLVNVDVVINGVTVPRGGCGCNSTDPDAPEFMKFKKIEHHSWLGWGTNIDKFNPTNMASNKTTIRNRNTRQDYIN